MLLEYNQHPESYPANLPTRSRPIGVVVTPMKGLASNIVNEVSKLNISAFSYCHETLSNMQKVGVHLTQEIMECVKWQVTCVDPEHLHNKE
ncbi:hypothetical protein K443DRAFT_14631 [Laccaria amethystina LaAM-08-1]|uniref:Uncharacterized protein n=1 Tax=Laccaria amethystina LaAM-08-1 TaxID=1095629 RepID=A0A0C9WHG9_9AGAR|nr:hypothetical protein K443DRAFT_14631 [Laccaria amethystina LaAM-08-1]